MGATPKQLFQVAVGTALSTAYTTAAAPAYAELLFLTLVNTTAAAIKVRLHLVPAAGAAETGNALIYDWALDVQGLPYNVPFKHVLPAGSTIQIQAAAVGVTATGTGLEVT